MNSKKQVTISVMFGRGNINHNCRNFYAPNVDPSRTYKNIEYCNIDIKDAFDELFGDALEKYNATRRYKCETIPDYYEKICSSKRQEPFYEMIVQVGNKDDMNALSEDGEVAKEILDEYFKGFQERNPNFYVISSHLHMDEVTPHLHIDFVPYVTGSKKGLETRLSLTGALKELGFTNGTREYSEWMMFADSEKKILSDIMEKHGIGWLQKGTHEKHLSVLEYKREQMSLDIERLDKEIASKKAEIDSLNDRIGIIQTGLESRGKLSSVLDKISTLDLPKAGLFMTPDKYIDQYVKPMFIKLKNLAINLCKESISKSDTIIKLQNSNKSLARELESCKNRLGETTVLEEKIKLANTKYYKLVNYIGEEKLDNMLEDAIRDRTISNRCLNHDIER